MRPGAEPASASAPLCACASRGGQPAGARGRVTPSPGGGNQRPRSSTCLCPCDPSADLARPAADMHLHPSPLGARGRLARRLQVLRRPQRSGGFVPLPAPLP
ncbi:unnamed protein product [Rangifer tarandus platyrhynchus]|uniref:Uncharacterized protein n=1 Tax=Rangifer tarandus platyrhynchus TaxID=3082113 RepID=A0AC59ZW97_RANTA